MPAAHHGGIKPLFDDFSGAGLDHRLTTHRLLAMRIFVEIVPDALRLLWTQQAGIRMGVSELQTRARCQHFVDRETPFLSKGFDPLSRHFAYSIRERFCYPAAPVTFA